MSKVYHNGLIIPLGVVALIVLSFGLTLLPSEAAALNAMHPSQTQPQPIPTNEPIVPVGEVPDAVCGTEFVDVQPGNSFFEGVQFMTCRGVVSGYNTNPPCDQGIPCFRPNVDISRGQLSKIVVLSHYHCNPCHNPPNPTFVDVPTYHTFYQYIETANLNGLVEARNYPYFEPDLPVAATRAEAAKASVLGAGYNLINPSTPSFRDVPTSHPFYRHIETGYARGLFSGYMCGGYNEPCPGVYYRPSSPITRGQVSKIDTAARFYHTAPYTGLNNWDDAIANYQPGLRTLPSGRANGYFNSPVSYLMSGGRILYTVAAVNWIDNNANGGQYKAGFMFTARATAGGCASGFFSYHYTDLAYNYISQYIGCEVRILIPNYPSGITPNTRHYYAEANWYDQGAYNFSGQISMANVQVDTGYWGGNRFTHADYLADYCYRSGIGLGRCP